MILKQWLNACMTNLAYSSNCEMFLNALGETYANLELFEIDSFFSFGKALKEPASTNLNFRQSLI